MTSSSPSLLDISMPIIGMIHLSGNSVGERSRIAHEEIAIMVEEGVDGIIIENYFGGTNDVRQVLEEVCENPCGCLVGINILGNNTMAFELANEFPVDFIQMDSVCGHLTATDDAAFEYGLAKLREAFNGTLLGGVRFKYQPVKSGRSERDDLMRGVRRVDAVVVTGEGTGMETDMAKLARFREMVGSNVPLLVGAGLTPGNVRAQLSHTNGAIVGSYFKEGHVDTGLVCRNHVRQIMNIVREIRLANKDEIEQNRP